MRRRGVHDAPRHDLRGELRRHFARPSDRRGARRAAIPRSRRSSSAAARAGPPRPRSRPPRNWASTPGSRSSTRSIRRCRLPVWIANFVLMDYGTGALFGVPAHDVRDFEFATKYHLPIRRVVASRLSLAPTSRWSRPRPGTASRSIRDFLDGMTSAEASAEVIRRAETAGWGQGKTQYRLRDWGVSRQRYWGTPIPIIHCDDVRPGRRAARPIARRPARGRQLRRSRQPARPPSDAGARSIARHAARRRGARPTRSTPSSIRAGISSASPASPTTSRSTAPRPRRGFRSANISAGSSMRSSTCSTRASGPARSSGSANCRSRSRSRGCSRKGW